MDFSMTVLGEIRHLPEKERKLMEEERRSIEEERKSMEERRRLGSNPPDWLVLFRQAEKEHLDLLASKEPVEFTDKHFCSEKRKHQLVLMDGEWTCSEECRDRLVLINGEWTCSEERKHELAPINGEWTCRECGLIDCRQGSRSLL